MTERQDLRGQETEHTEQTADRREADRKLEGCGATVKKTTRRTHRRRRLLSSVSFRRSCSCSLFLFLGKEKPLIIR